MKDEIKKQETNLANRPYSKKELCQLYGISSATLRNWLFKHEKFFQEKYKKIFTALEVKFIFDHYGDPRLSID